MAAGGLQQKLLGAKGRLVKKLMLLRELKTLNKKLHSKVYILREAQQSAEEAKMRPRESINTTPQVTLNRQAILIQERLVQLMDKVPSRSQTSSQLYKNPFR